MSWVSIEAGRRYLAGPIRRVRVASQAALMVPVTPACHGVRVMVRRIDGTGGATGPFSAEATRPFDRSDIRLCSLAMPLGGFDDVATHDLAWDIDLDIPHPLAPGAAPGPGAVLETADLLLRDALPLIVDEPPAGGDRLIDGPARGELMCRLGPLSLGRLSFRRVEPNEDQVADALRRELAIMARRPETAALIRGVVGGRSPARSLAAMSLSELAAVTDRMFSPDFGVLASDVQLQALRLLAPFLAENGLPTLELSGLARISVFGVSLHGLEVPVRAVVDPNQLRFGAPIRLADLLAAKLDPDLFDAGTDGVFYGRANFVSAGPESSSFIDQLAASSRWVGSWHTGLAGVGLRGAVRAVMASGPPMRPRRGSGDRSRVSAIESAARPDRDGRPLLLDPDRSDADLGLGDVLPEGGLIGAGTLALPALLVDPPGNSLRRLDAFARPSVWRSSGRFADAMAELFAPQAVGRLAFALPSPPGFQVEAAHQPLPEPTDPVDAFESTNALFSLVLDGTILGVGLQGARSGSGPGLTFDVTPRARWLRDLFGGLAPRSLRLTIGRRSSGLPVEAVAALFNAVVQDEDDIDTAVAAALAPSVGEWLGGGSDWPGASGRVDAAALTEARERIQTAVSTGTRQAAQLLVEMILQALPDIGVEQHLDIATIPLIGDVLRIDQGVDFRIESPRLSRSGSAVDSRIVVDVHRSAVNVLGMVVRVPRFSITVDIRGPMPILTARIRLPEAPFRRIGLRSPHLVIDSSQPVPLGIEGELRPLSWRLPGGTLRISGADGGPIPVRLGSGDSLVEIGAAKVEVDVGFVRAHGQLHGPSPGEPATISLTGPWAATVMLDDVRLAHPLDPSVDLASWHGVGAALSGTGTKTVNLVTQLADRTVDLITALSGSTLSGSSLRLDSLGTPAFESTLEVAVGAIANVRADVRASLDEFELRSAEIEVPALDVTWSGRLSIADDGISGQSMTSNAAGPVGFAGLLDTAASAWSLTLGEQLSLAPTSAVSRMLGAQLPTSDQHVELTVSSGGAIAMSYRSDNWWSPPGLANLFGIRPEIECSATGLTIRADWRALETGGQWRRTGTATWNWTDADPHLELPGSLAALLGSGGVVRNASGARLRVVPGPGDWRIELRGATARVLWATFSLPTATIDANGRADFAIDAPGFSANGLTWQPTGALRVRIDLRAPSDSGRYWVPAGPVTAAFAGLPALSLPRIPTTGWSSSTSPTRSGSSSATGTWRTVPLVGSATATQYRAAAPRVTVRLRSTTPRLRVEVDTGGLIFRQWVPDNPFTPEDDGHWTTLSLTAGSATHLIDSTGGLTSAISFPNGLPGAGSDTPSISGLLS